jgi:hypothetical protein
MEYNCLNNNSVDRDCEVSLTLKRLEARPANCGLFVFLCKSLVPGKRRKQLDSASEELLESPYYTSDKVPLTTTLKAGTTYILVPCIADRSQSKLSITIETYATITIKELLVPKDKPTDNDCSEILKKFRTDSDKYYSENPVDEITQYLLQSNQLFVDKFFPPNENSANWDDGRNKTEIPVDKWSRTSELFDRPEVFVNGIDMNDINQGGIGNCWLCQGIAGLTTRTDIIENMIYPKTLSPVGVYSVKLFINDRSFKYILVDDYFPTANGNVKGMRSKDGDELWSMLVEKAFAKHYGSYRSMASHTMGEALEMLTGGEVVSHIPSKIRDEPEDKENLWQKLVTYTQNKWLMALSTDQDDESVKDQGLVHYHAYTMLAAIEIPWANNLRLCKVRNTWGFYEWSGDYSDKSDKWTKELREYLKVEDANDGVFYLTFDDLLKFFGWINLCKVLQDVQYKHQHTTKIIGKWNETGGGYRIKNNTRIKFTLVKNAPVVFTITKLSAETADGGESKFNRLYTLLVQTDKIQPKDNYYYSSEFIEEHYCNTARQHIVFEKELIGGTYYIVPFLEHAHYKGEFEVMVNCSVPIELNVDETPFSTFSDPYQTVKAVTVNSTTTPQSTNSLWSYSLTTVFPQRISLDPVLDKALSVVVVDSEVYVFSEYIYKLQNSSLVQVSKESGWAECFTQALNGKIYAISRATGKIFSWDPSTCTYETLSDENWKNEATGKPCFCAVQEGTEEYLYIYCSYIYKFNVNSRTYTKESIEGGWQMQLDASVINRDIHTVDSSNGKMYVWNMDIKNFRVLTTEDWSQARPMISRGTQLCLFQKDVWTVYPSGYTYCASDTFYWNSLYSVSYDSINDTVWCLDKN